MSEPEEKLQGEQRDSTKKKKKEKRSGKKKKKEKKEQEEEQQVEEEDERWVLALRFLQFKVPHRTMKELSDWSIGPKHTDESEESTLQLKLWNESLNLIFLVSKITKVFKIGNPAVKTVLK